MAPAAPAGRSEGALAAIGEDGLAAPEWDDPEGAEEDGELAARRIGEITDAAARLVPIDQDGAPADPDEMLFAGIDDAIRVADELAAGGDAGRIWPPSASPSTGRTLTLASR